MNAPLKTTASTPASVLTSACTTRASAVIDEDYLQRRGEISAYGRAVKSSHTLRLRLLVTGGAVIVLLLLAIVLVPATQSLPRLVMVAAIAILCFGLCCLWRYMREHFIDPDLAFRKWLQQVCDGELSARIELPTSHRHYKELDFHTRNLASALRQLSTDMESLVDSQTQRLENQNRVLELLFQVTSDVAAELDFQTVLNTACTHLAEWMEDAQVAGYVVDQAAAQLKLEAVGNADQQAFTATRPLTDLPDTATGAAGVEGAVRELNNGSAGANNKAKQYGYRIPIYKGRELAGMVEVVADDAEELGNTESQRIFQTVSEQLSMFVTRESALEAAHHSRLVRERNQLGAEIHDSLAQTLLAARYQTSLLRETMLGSSAASLYNDVVRIEGMIDEANVEVRGLIGEYRKPLSEHRYADTIKNTIDNFNRSSPIEVFFQLNNPDIRFTAREHSVIERIVSEALVNAKKYSKATMIRVYVRDEASGVRSVLIEDDGIGFCTNTPSTASPTTGESAAGNHIGLSIMQDRALSIGANLTIDSEPGEGTRVFLKLPPLALSDEG